MTFEHDIQEGLFQIPLHYPLWYSPHRSIIDPTDYKEVFASVLLISYLYSFLFCGQGRLILSFFQTAKLRMHNHISLVKTTI